ncbi:MAG TPA: hypothetical protein VEF35_00060 [Candidatus Bathyarchaeia archaeon]|nr:hypothetical protein [Candidatus Bathyarchaeia archaeon]
MNAKAPQKGIFHDRDLIKLFFVYGTSSTKYWSGTQTATRGVVFPRLEDIAPLVAEACVKNHRGLDAAFDKLNRSYSSGDPLKTARATAAFRFHLTCT